MDLMTFLTDARSVITLICMITFIGIVLWAWSARRQADFDEAAMLPFADEVQPTIKEQEPRHG